MRSNYSLRETEKNYLEGHTGKKNVESTGLDVSAKD
jgi:hypothetical protein